MPRPRLSFWSAWRSKTTLNIDVRPAPRAGPAHDVHDCREIGAQPLERKGFERVSRKARWTLPVGWALPYARAPQQRVRAVCRTASRANVDGSIVHSATASA